MMKKLLILSIAAFTCFYHSACFAPEIGDFCFNTQTVWPSLYRYSNPAYDSICVALKGVRQNSLYGCQAHEGCYPDGIDFASLKKENGESVGSPAVGCPYTNFYPIVCTPERTFCVAANRQVIIDSTTVTGGLCQVLAIYAAYPTALNSAMDPYNDGYCDYINTCTTPTHCKSGYYKDGNTCKECPEKSSGATSPYLNVGPVDVCYKIIDPVSGTDSAGTFNYTNITNGNQCKYSL